MSLGQQHCFCGSSLGWDEPHTGGSSGSEGSAEGRGMGCQPGGLGVVGQSWWQRAVAFTAAPALQRPHTHSVGDTEPLQGTLWGTPSPGLSPCSRSSPRLGQPLCDRRGCKTTKYDCGWPLTGGEQPGVCPAAPALSQQAQRLMAGAATPRGSAGRTQPGSPRGAGDPGRCRGWPWHADCPHG